MGPYPRSSAHMALQSGLQFLRPPSLLPLPLPVGERTHGNDRERPSDLTFPGCASKHLKRRHWGAGKHKPRASEGAAEPHAGPSRSQGTVPATWCTPFLSHTPKRESGRTRQVDYRGRGGRERTDRLIPKGSRWRICSGSTQRQSGQVTGGRPAS